MKPVKPGVTQIDGVAEHSPYLPRVPMVATGIAEFEFVKVSRQTAERDRFRRVSLEYGFHCLLAASLDTRGKPQHMRSTICRGEFVLPVASFYGSIGINLPALVALKFVHHSPHFDAG
jgi:hypothetical protein